MPIVILIISTLAFWFIFWFFRMGGLERIERARQYRGGRDGYTRRRGTSGGGNTRAARYGRCQRGKLCAARN